MATIQRLKKPAGKFYYRAMVRIQGHPTVSKNFPRKADAELWAQTTESDIRRGRWTPSRDALRRTVADAIDRYVDQVLSGSSNRNAKRTEKHLQWWRDEIGNQKLAYLTPAAIVECRDRLKKGDQETDARKGSTVNRYLAAMSALLTTAVKEWGWLETNPMAGVRRYPESKGRTRFLSETERGQLLEACKASDSRYLYPLVVLALATGARYGELINMHWADVELNRKRITFPNTKNGETRSVPMVGHAYDVIRDLSKIRRINTDFVFPGRRGDKPAFLAHVFARAVKRAGISDFRFHDLRHTAASYLAMSGASIAEIAEILGHKTLSMVKRYSHMTEQHTAGVLERMNEKMF